MSWNISLSVLPNTDLAHLDPGSQALSLDEATDAFQLMGAQIGAHVVLIDPFYGVTAQLAAAQADAQLYTVSLGGTADTYAIEAHGPHTRLRVVTAGEVTTDQGTPLPAESALTGHDFDEDAHLAVFEALLGAPVAALQQAEFHELPFEL